MIILAFKSKCPFLRCITRAMNDPEEPLNSVSKIDRLSRWVGREVLEKERNYRIFV